eukprot:Phypoly_transcript_15160.p1 GENE.Phypoly_transcript_15160~~Phypoly_transcript_15160.p1  ORF type:complete len:272 (+),score=50.53 Phypoly_transcript_15160:58-873(+)
MTTPFDQRKAHILATLTEAQTDRSPKGSVDTAILPLLSLINSIPGYVSTSSCSGRISVFHQCNSEIKEEKDEYNSTVPPKERWLFVSHDPISDVTAVANDLFERLRGMKFQTEIGSKQSVLFRFEPFILHIEAKDSQAAQELAALAYQNGLRLTGILPGKHHIIISIRSTMIMDVPLWFNGNVLINHDYLLTLLAMANEKFTINTTHMTKLYNTIEEHFSKPKEIKERRQPRHVNPTNSTNFTNPTKKEEQGLDVADFGDDFAAMIGVEGE